MLSALQKPNLPRMPGLEWPRHRFRKNKKEDIIVKHVILAGIALALTFYSGLASAQNVSNYTEQGGARTVIGGELDIVSGGSLEINGTAITATAAEINRIADDSARVVTVTDTYAAACATNGTGVINYISSSSANATVTLPAATGTGCVYEFTWLAAPTGSGDVIQVTGDDSFNGVFWMANDSDATASAFETSSDTDKLTFTSSTKGVSQAGAWIRFQDAATDKFVITGSSLIGTGSEATPGATGQRP